MVNTRIEKQEEKDSWRYYYIIIIWKPVSFTTDETDDCHQSTFV
jgi:hypothetical protein